MRYLAIPALLLAAACGSSPSQKPRAQPAPAAFTFDWSPPCRVPVTEEWTKDRSAATLHYEIVLTRNEDATLTVGREHVEFVAIAGQPIPPDKKPGLAAAELLLELLPTATLDASGQVVGAGDPARYIEAYLATTIGPGDSDAKEQLRAAMSSPRARKTLEAAMGDQWSTWVGLWVGWSVQPGQPAERPAAEIFGEGTTGTVRFEHLGFDDGHAHLRMSAVATGQGVRALAPGLFDDIAASLGADPASMDSAAAQGTFAVEVTTDPTTLRPTSEVTEVNLSIPTRGQPPAERKDRHETTFDWAHATGCGKP